MKFNGRNHYVSSSAILGENVKLGDNVSIYDNVTIGSNSIIANDCVIGEPTSDYYHSENYVNTPTNIAAGALIRSHSIIYSGVSIGTQFQSGHRITIRENTVIGNHCRVGTNSDLQGFIIIGNYCQLHSNVHLCQFSSLGNFVFIYPNVVLANDTHPPTENVRGPEIGDYTQIGIQSSIIGNIQIGENCLIGAGSVITRDFDAFSLIIGSPATLKSDVRELIGLDGKPLYPWKTRFNRGMPWDV